ncbi:hypothetical protein [Flexithrix dorotheae]|uniref:hypothetical protein n=1 Tax=Flexithrix dorotheae TaxID=70993 RepID=UPI00036149AE|nr:hypothetical protein [Flexithrix dorotheae]
MSLKSIFRGGGEINKKRKIANKVLFPKECFNPEKYVIIHVNREKSLLHYRWKRTTSRMDEDDYKLTIAYLFHLVFTQKISRIIADHAHKDFTIGVHLQPWTARIMELGAKLGVKKVAIIESKDFITQLSLEQIVEFVQKNNTCSEVKFFKDYALAFQWIFAPGLSNPRPFES